MSTSHGVREHTEHTGIRKTVYLIRHGQSEGNVAANFQSPSSPLSEIGRMQARQIAACMAKMPLEALVTSFFPRARETAAEITRSSGIEAELSELFVERIKPTSIDDQPFSDPHAAAVWREWEQSLRTPGMRVEDGENFDDQVARADRALLYLQDRPEKRIAVVTHGYFLRTIVARVLLGPHLTPEAYGHLHQSAHTQNTGMTVLHYQSGYDRILRWVLWTYNDHAHLA